MTLELGAILIWAVGIYWRARSMPRNLLRFLESDSTNMCDGCRDRRRRGNLLVSRESTWCAAIGFTIAAAAWPVLEPIRLARIAVHGRHRCDRAREASP